MKPIELANETEHPHKHKAENLLEFFIIDSPVCHQWRRHHSYDKQQQKISHRYF